MFYPGNYIRLSFQKIKPKGRRDDRDCLDESVVSAAGCAPSRKGERLARLASAGQGPLDPLSTQASGLRLALTTPPRKP
jgi:hypothetical protein